MQIDTSDRRPRITAVLGPTNTGKTHFAMERMLAHASGMIGFPLRLLARENYERAVKARGEARVALITGEEKIVPPGAKYFLCTVEAMPIDRRVAFLGVDEVQMCADPDRGHVFTQRLLHARGTEETMFMGAETAKPLLRALIPEAEIEGRPRMSVLRHAGNRKITRLPSRSVVVAFSAADVYAIAELVRRQRGGAAVVLGALSPRTRNAQVALYQGGEVDYLVATDAIGMGLNMDVDHVAFAGLRKFDGRFARELNPAELGQIAGRAGRHMNDGTFGTTADARPMDPETVDRIENHVFEPLRFLFWRNHRLRFASTDVLVRDLARKPEEPGLVRAREADDELALHALLREDEIRRVADHPDRVGLLWEVAQVPDFRKVMSDAHARLLGRIYGHLTGPKERLPTDWVAKHVESLDKTEGDIEALMQRIAHIRTWTYVSHRGDWLEDAGNWQGLTRAVEDRLSDALHERLTQRFVDKRTAVLVSRLKARQKLVAEVGRDGRITVEGQDVGHLEGFRYVPDETESGAAQKAVTNAATAALKDEVAGRIKALEEAGDDAIKLSADGSISWNDAAIARLAKGADPLSPMVEVLTTDLLEADDRERIRVRLATWLTAHLRARLEAIFLAREAELEGTAKGLAFQLGEGLGSLRRMDIKDLVEGIPQTERKKLREVGIRFGRESVYAPSLVKSGPVALRGLLWCLWNGRDDITPPPDGRMSVAIDDSRPKAYLEAIGYRPLGPLALRIDILERVAAKLWELGQKGPFAIPAEVLNLVGCSAEDMDGVLRALGYGRRKPKAPAPEAAPETTPDAAAAEETTAEAAPAEAPAADETPASEAPTTEAPATEAPAAGEGDEAAKAEAPEPEALYALLPRRPRKGGDRNAKGGERTKGKHPDKGGRPKGKGPRKDRGKGGPRQPKDMSFPPPGKGKGKKQEYDPDSPFAKLAELKLKK